MVTGPDVRRSAESGGGGGGVPADLVQMLWGNDMQQAIFERWSQPFLFTSPDERSALVQLEGGPCSVLTCVQAHLLRELIFCGRCTAPSFSWRQASREEIDLHFLNALVSILQLLSSSASASSTTTRPVLLASLETDPQLSPPVPSVNGDGTPSSSSFQEFHSRVKFSPCTSPLELKQNVYTRLNMWKSDYGVLLFLYSCLATKTVQQMMNEIDDISSLPLIDIAHGHGSQCLTNLLITGVATPHSFDGDKDVEGLKLVGVPRQASIGFLSTLEVYRLMEVGWFLKNPRTPIWILGSETHLTVVFSREASLVEEPNKEEETPMKKALKIFRKYDTEKNGFIANSLLDQVIAEMDLHPSPSVSELKNKMDPDGLSIITEQAFLHELFPSSSSSSSSAQQQDRKGPLTGKPFVLYHYNGLPRSNKNNTVKYALGEGTIGDFGYGGQDVPESALAPVVPGSYLPITGVLRTKWPTIELRWDEDVKPSLN